MKQSIAKLVDRANSLEQKTIFSTYDQTVSLCLLNTFSHRNIQVKIFSTQRKVCISLKVWTKSATFMKKTRLTLKVTSCSFTLLNLPPFAIWGNLIVPKDRCMNKIGHGKFIYLLLEILRIYVTKYLALHVMEPLFNKITFSSKTINLFKDIGFIDPVIPQSMYIFKVSENPFRIVMLDFYKPENSTNCSNQLSVEKLWLILMLLFCLQLLQIKLLAYGLLWTMLL